MRAALKALRDPLPQAHVRELRAAYDACQRDGDVAAPLAVVQALETAEAEPIADPIRSIRPLAAEDLHLVCWEYVWS